MPKIIAHALTGAAIVIAIAPKSQLNKWSLLLGALLALSPDFDFAVEWLINVPDFHRGLTHSLLISCIVGIIFCMLHGAAEQRLALAYALAYLSHSLLDFATSTKGGVKLLWPFSDDYYHLGWTKMLEVPFGPGIREILTWMLLETVIFLPVLMIVLLAKKLIR